MWLEREIEEVKKAIECCAGDKTPGPNGFSLAFFQHCWSTVKTEVMATIGEFQERGNLEKSLNVSFVVIIAKQEGASSMKDYRPISIMGSIYKIISKVLSIRLKKVLDETISTSQNALWKVDRFYMQLW